MGSGWDGWRGAGVEQGGRGRFQGQSEHGLLLTGPLLGAELGEHLLRHVVVDVAVAVHPDAGEVARALRPLDG